MRLVYSLKNYAFSYVFIFLSYCIAAQEREVLNLHSGWKFYLGPNENASSINCNEADWQSVTIPHDWAITGPFDPNGDGNTAKLPWKGEGWYRYTWTMPASMKSKRIILLFDGVMAFPQVYVNGQLAGKWDYGYNSFYVDVTDKLNANGKNVFAVHADARQHDSRWYPGAGIYRKVQLIPVNPIHVNIWGTQVTTPIIKSNYAKVDFTTTISNQSPADVAEIEIEQIILGPKGNKISSTLLKGSIAANTSKEFEGNATLTDPDRWDVNHGALYTLRTIVREGDLVMDEFFTPFGVRSIRFTPDDGFYLNDRRVQLKGVCLHHDQGPLGAAFYPRAMERQLQLLKSMGCNAIRTSHNCPAPELLELCDKMGILVIDEIFDKYDRKADIMDTTDFEKFAHRNVHNFVTRDRNHPCIFLWSVGNEIGDVQWNKNGGFEKLGIMTNEFHHYDRSRPLTLVCDSRNSASLRHFEYYDVHSWNYGRRYDLARQLEPNKAVIISESASTVSTRDFYEWPLPQKKTDFTKSLQVSSYDLNAPDWAEIPDDDFMWQEEENYVAGEFVWTGFDYLGEPTPYDNAAVKRMGMTDKDASVSSYFGIFDLVGIPKDRYYLYKSYWDKSDTTIHILPHWNWPGMEGKNIPVYVYTSGDCAELFLNGKSLGTKCKTPDSAHSTERFRLMWNEVTYDPGELKAVAYKEGVKIGESKITTAGKPYALRLTPDRNTIHSDGLDLSYVLIEIVDDHGIVCPAADLDIKLEVSGAGLIAGVGNGNPQSIAPFQSDHVLTFHGKAMLILRSATQKGTIAATATSPNLQEQKVTIAVE